MVRSQVVSSSILSSRCLLPCTISCLIRSLTGYNDKARAYPSCADIRPQEDGDRYRSLQEGPWSHQGQWPTAGASRAPDSAHEAAGWSELCNLIVLLVLWVNTINKMALVQQPK